MVHLNIIHSYVNDIFTQKTQTKCHKTLCIMYGVKKSAQLSTVGNAKEEKENGSVEGSLMSFIRAKQHCRTKTVLTIKTLCFYYAVSRHMPGKNQKCARCYSVDDFQKTNVYIISSTVFNVFSFQAVKHDDVTC